MNGPIAFDAAVTLVGAGPFEDAALRAAMAHAPHLVAADGAADRLAALRLSPEAVIGDMDSVRDPATWQRPGTRFVHLAEQDTTDFEKCLYSTEAPFYIAVGFTGGRADHALAVLHALLRYRDRPVLVMGEAEVSVLVPPGRRLRVAVDPGERVSLYPLVPVRAGRSRGLVWPVDGLEMAPGQRIGTSNEAAAPVIELEFDDPGMLLMLDRARLGALIGAVAPGRQTAPVSNPAR